MAGSSCVQVPAIEYSSRHRRGSVTWLDGGWREVVTTQTAHAGTRRDRVALPECTGDW